MIIKPYVRPLKETEIKPIKVSNLIKNSCKKCLIYIFLATMKRTIYKNLLLWKQSQYKSHLIVKGARQMGKTFIIKGFGENEFPSSHVFNFEKDKQLAVIFEENLDPNRIIKELSVYSGKVIDTQHEIQNL